MDLPAHYDFVLGVPGSLGASERALDFMIGSLPPGSSWTVAGVGRHQLPMAEARRGRGRKRPGRPRGQRLREQGRPREGQLGAGRRGGEARPRRGRGDRHAPAGPRAAATRMSIQDRSRTQGPGDGFQCLGGLLQHPASGVFVQSLDDFPRLPDPLVRPARWHASRRRCGPARRGSAAPGRAPSSRAGGPDAPGPLDVLEQLAHALGVSGSICHGARLPHGTHSAGHSRRCTSVTFAESKGTKSASPPSSSAFATWKMPLPAG